jgi:hypothetical protein
LEVKKYESFWNLMFNIYLKVSIHQGIITGKKWLQYGIKTYYWFDQPVDTFPFSLYQKKHI